MADQPVELNDEQLDAVTGGIGQKALATNGKDEADTLTLVENQIDQALTKLMNSQDRFNQMLDTMTDAIKDRGNTLANAKFRG